MKTYEGNLSAEKFKFAVILSRFNESIGNNLLEAAIDCLKKHNCKEENIDIFKVPGAFEIPVTANKIAAQKKYDVIITLGAVIRGATPHFDYVSNGVSSGIQQVAIKNSLPVIFGVLTTDTIEQAIERSGSKDRNKGRECALAAIAMADLFKEIS